MHKVPIKAAILCLFEDSLLSLSMALICVWCRKKLQCKPTMIISCGSLIHVRCLRKLYLRQIRKVSEQKPKRFRVREVFGLPLTWFMFKCPGCNKYTTPRDLHLLTERLRGVPKAETERSISPTPSLLADLYWELNPQPLQTPLEMSRTPSPSPSLLAELEELSDISERDFQ